MASDSYDGRRAVQNQLARLFGSESKAATADIKTDEQWRKTLKSVLAEIECYVAANVDTDEFHRMALASGLLGANEALKQDDFWPGYVEGITRLALTLLGDYPDHRKRKKGRKEEDHYKLNRFRSLQFAQTPEQRFLTLFGAGSAGFPMLSAYPLDILHEFRRQYGYKPTHANFLEWYRVKYPKDYTTIFR
jgi:hypothetical protein